MNLRKYKRFWLMILFCQHLDFYLSLIDYITDTTIIHKILKICRALPRITITLTVPAYRQVVEQVQYGVWIKITGTHHLRTIRYVHNMQKRIHKWQYHELLLYYNALHRYVHTYQKDAPPFIIIIDFDLNITYIS